MRITVIANHSAIRYSLPVSPLNDRIIKLISLVPIHKILSVVHGVHNMIPETGISGLTIVLVLAHEESLAAHFAFVVAAVVHVP